LKPSAKAEGVLYQYGRNKSVTNAIPELLCFAAVEERPFPGGVQVVLMGLETA